MARIVVAGIVNVETTVPVEGLPLAYEPVRYLRDQLCSQVSGVGFNVAGALVALGHEVRLATYLGPDLAGDVARAELSRRGVSGPGVQSTRATPQSVVLTAPDGRRSVFTDLKDVPEESFPASVFAGLLDGADVGVLSTVGFARSLVPMVQARGLPIAVDVQAAESIDDPYLRDWLAGADIVFASHERLSLPPGEWAQSLLARFPAGIVGIGCGADGCMLCVRGEMPRLVPAVAPRGVVSTVGAGDALFAAFLDGRVRGRDPDDAIERAVLYAGWKVGSVGGGDGLLSSAELDQLSR
ncbi:MAG: sugar kinase [Pseudonocardiales bacterium]|nr:MAG: sugar kinase [Pseudonocardiales bacterium]